MILLALALAVSAASPANAADGNAAGAPPPAAAAEKKDNKRICRMPKDQTGTRLPRAVCKTQAEWDNQSNDASSVLSRSH